MLNWNWKRFGDLLYEGWDHIILANDFDVVDGIERAIMYIRELSPSARIVTYGRLSHSAPNLFMDCDLDGIVLGGDPEPALLSFIEGAPAELGDTLNSDAMLAIRNSGQWSFSTSGGFLDPAEWCLPDPKEVPYADYAIASERDDDKFAAIPRKRELVIPVARGCPIGCSFCDVPSLQGRRERRISVEAALAYIDKYFASNGFDYVSFYAPTFTLNRKWVLSLCQSLAGRAERVPWKCATTLYHLDRELLEQMAGSGCVRVSVGVETLSDNRADLPRLKRLGNAHLIEVRDWCSEFGIELNCFVIVGLPNDTVADVLSSTEILSGMGVHIRPTAYTPFEELRKVGNLADANRYNRQLLPRSTRDFDERHRLYSAIFRQLGAPSRANVADRA